MQQTRMCATCPNRNIYPTYSGDKYACKKYGLNVRKDQLCPKGDPLFEYNFPKYKDIPGDSWEEKKKQVEYTIGELQEALEAIERKDDGNFVEELLDAHHANETTLRSIPKQTVDEAVSMVIKKNADRGYYGDGFEVPEVQ